MDWWDRGVTDNYFINKGIEILKWKWPWVEHTLGPWSVTRWSHCTFQHCPNGPWQHLQTADTAERSAIMIDGRPVCGSVKVLDLCQYHGDEDEDDEYSVRLTTNVCLTHHLLIIWWLTPPNSTVPIMYPYFVSWEGSPNTVTNTT